MDEGLLELLEHGPVYRFADYSELTAAIPGSGAGVYTIWDDDGSLVYVGIAGRNPGARASRAGYQVTRAATQR